MQNDAGCLLDQSHFKDYFVFIDFVHAQVAILLSLGHVVDVQADAILLLTEGSAQESRLLFFFKLGLDSQLPEQGSVLFGLLFEVDHDRNLEWMENKSVKVYNCNNNETGRHTYLQPGQPSEHRLNIKIFHFRVIHRRKVLINTHDSELGHQTKALRRHPQSKYRAK